MRNLQKRFTYELCYVLHCAFLDWNPKERLENQIGIGTGMGTGNNSAHTSLKPERNASTCAATPEPSVASTTAARYSPTLAAVIGMSSPPGRSSYSAYPAGAQRVDSCPSLGVGFGRHAHVCYETDPGQQDRELQENASYTTR